MIESCSKSAVFDFGGVAVALSCRDERFMSLVRQRYGSFSTQRPPALRISYLVDGERAPHPRAIHAARQRPLGACRRGTRYALDGGTFRGEWDRATETMEIRGPLATYPVDRLIEAMVYAVEARVVILHAAALVFAGPLEAIYLLEHATKNRRRRLSVRDAAKRLRSQVIWPAFGHDNLRNAFDTFCGVIEQVPVWELGFRPEKSVRSVLTGEAGE